MASIVYDNFVNDIVNGAYDPASATFYAMLVTDAYTPNKGTDHYRQDVLNQAGAEVSGATGYVAGGMTLSCAVSLNPTAHTVTMTFGSPTWNSSSITARGAVVYHARGGVASADELVGYVDFGMDVTSTNGNFTVVLTTPLVFQL